LPGDVLLQSSGSAQSWQGDRGAFNTVINIGNEQQVRGQHSRGLEERLFA